MAVSRAPAAPEITVTGTWCACGMRLSHPNEEVRGFCACVYVKEEGGGATKEGGKGQEIPRNRTFSCL